MKQKLLEIQSVSVNRKQNPQNQKRSNKKYQFTNIEKVKNLDSHIEPIFLQQIMPQKIRQKIQKQQLQEDIYSKRDFENSNLTKFIYEQILILKFSMMMMTILSIGLSILFDEIIQLGGKQFKDRILIIHTLISACLVIFAIMKHVKNQQLEERQLMKKKSESNLEKLSPLTVLQIVFLTIHPNLLTENSIFFMEEPIHGGYLPFQFNELFQITMMMRIYLIYSALLSSSIYLSTRASRICRIYGTKNTTIFGIKCIFNEKPILALLILFLSLLFVLANMVKLSEMHVQASQLNEFKNSVWCVVITMGTVGYGEYSPTTYFGRIILFLVSIAGILMSSLLILTLSTYLSMNLSENKSHITLQRLSLRESLQQLAKQVIGLTTQISQKEIKSDENMKLLKKKSDEVHHMSRKIKNLIDTDNINEEMNRLFEGLTDNMYEIFKKQQENSQLMVKLYELQKNKIEEIKFSFTDEIQTLIKDR